MTHTVGNTEYVFPTKYVVTTNPLQSTTTDYNPPVGKETENGQLCLYEFPSNHFDFNKYGNQFGYAYHSHIYDQKTV